MRPSNEEDINKKYRIFFTTFYCGFEFGFFFSFSYVVNPLPGAHFSFSVCSAALNVFKYLSFKRMPKNQHFFSSVTIMFEVNIGFKLCSDLCKIIPICSTLLDILTLYDKMSKIFFCERTFISFVDVLCKLALTSACLI